MELPLFETDEENVKLLLEKLEEQHPGKPQEQVLRLIVEQCLIMSGILKTYDDMGFGSTLPIDTRKELMQALLFVAGIAKDGPQAVGDLTPVKVINNVKEILGQALSEAVDELVNGEEDDESGSQAN